jgi:hypothetical protein
MRHPCLCIRPQRHISSISVTKTTLKLTVYKQLDLALVSIHHQVLSGSKDTEKPLKPQNCLKQEAYICLYYPRYILFSQCHWPFTPILFKCYVDEFSGPTGRAVWSVGLRPLPCWDCGFESHRGHGCLLWLFCVLSGRSLCDSSRGVLPNVVHRCIWSRNLVNEKAMVHWGLSHQNKRTNKQI